MNSKVYSPPCAAITSCSTRGACSPVGCSRRLEYASWGQATICQIRPIAHVRCAVYSVLLSRVCVANVSCMQRVVHRANFRKAPEGYDWPSPSASKTRPDMAQIREMQFTTFTKSRADSWSL